MFRVWVQGANVTVPLLCNIRNPQTYRLHIFSAVIPLVLCCRASLLFLTRRTFPRILLPAQLVSERTRDLLGIQVKESSVRLLGGLAEHNYIRLRGYRAAPTNRHNTQYFVRGPQRPQKPLQRVFMPVRFQRPLAVVHRIGATPAPYADHIIIVAPTSKVLTLATGN